MTLERRHVRFLASVTNKYEAWLAATSGADLIDCKKPSEGALGALPVEAVREIRRVLADRVVSATIGDLPAEPEPIFAAAHAMGETGVDYVKIGFFAGGDARATIARLAQLSGGGVGLVGILLADCDPDFSLIADMQRAGFRGVMLDTAGKDGRTLRDHMSAAELGRFVREAQSAGLLAGLAGSLKISDIPDLAALAPDILGFRGALCAAQDRQGSLDSAAVRAVRHAISNSAPSGATTHLETSL